MLFLGASAQFCFKTAVSNHLVPLYMHWYFHDLIIPTHSFFPFLVFFLGNNSASKIAPTEYCDVYHVNQILLMFWFKAMCFRYQLIPNVSLLYLMITWHLKSKLTEFVLLAITRLGASAQFDMLPCPCTFTGNFLIRLFVDDIISKVSTWFFSVNLKQNDHKTELLFVFRRISFHSIPEIV